MIFEVVSASDKLIAAMESAQHAVASRADRVGSIRADFEVRAGRIKHDSFKDEREYRLIVLLFGQQELVSHRPSRSTLVPYVLIPPSLHPSGAFYRVFDDAPVAFEVECLLGSLNRGNCIFQPIARNLGKE